MPFSGTLDFVFGGTITVNRLILVDDGRSVAFDSVATLDGDHYLLDTRAYLQDDGRFVSDEIPPIAVIDAHGRQPVVRPGFVNLPVVLSFTNLEIDQDVLHVIGNWRIDNQDLQFEGDLYRN